MLHGSYGFNLADEGFFWYGAKQTAKGEVPGLDFMAYEPGRYYWAATVFKALGNDSNKSGRIASVVFGAIIYGLVSSMLIDSRRDIDRVKAIFSTFFLSLSLSIWSFPYYRITDIAGPCISFWLCYRQYERRTLQTSLANGFWLGLVMFFGRNHALYTLTGLFIVLMYIVAEEKDITRTLKRAGLGATGMVAGISPFIVLTILRPEYLATLVGQWISALKTGKTNLDLPWPLPWRTITSGMPLKEADGHLIIGLIFMSLFAITIAGVALVAIAAFNGKRAQPELAAMTAATAGYLHYAIARADMEHIGPAFMPMLLGVFLWGMRGKKAVKASCLIALVIPTVRVAARQQSAYHCVRNTLPCSRVYVDKYTSVRASSETAGITHAALRAIGSKRFLALPAYPTLYAIKGIRSPIWDIYAAWPRSLEEQNSAIRQIRARRVETVLLNKNSFGSEAGYELTNTLVYSFLKKEYIKCGILTGSKIEVLQIHERSRLGCDNAGDKTVGLD